MGHKLYLFGIYSITLLSLGLWLLLLVNVNPYLAPTWIIITFYLTLFIIISGVAAIIGFYAKVKLSNREVIFAHLSPTLRQGALLAFFLVGILFLAQVNAISWWMVCLFLISIIMLELFFRSQK